MTETPIDAMYAGLARGDIAAVAACFAPDARLWHSFDGIEQDAEAAAQGWAGLIAHSEARGIADVRRHPIENGLVQQHVFWLRTPGGVRKAWPVCLVVRLEGDRIARLEEYMDRAGSFDPGDGPIATPGF